MTAHTFAFALVIGLLVGTVLGWSFGFFLGFILGIESEEEQDRAVVAGETP